MTWKKTETVTDKVLDDKDQASATQFEEHAIVKELLKLLRYPDRNKHHAWPHSQA